MNEAAASWRDAPAPQLPEPVCETVQHDDLELALFRWPRAGAPTLLLVHGIGMAHRVYDRFIDVARHRFDVVAVDLPGFGDTREPDRARSISETADFLAECLRECGIGPVAAVGHSMGAQVVAELAARHPRLVDRVVLVAPTVDPAERSVLVQAARMLQDLAGEPRQVLVKGLIAYADTGVRWFLKKLESTLEHRMERVLPRVQQPTLVLRGSRDPVCSRGWALRIVGLMPDAELEQLADRGHEALIASGEPAARCVTEWMHGAPSSR